MPPRARSHNSHPLSDSTIAMRERARELIAEARRNGVEHELRDGRDFIVLRLPSVELRPAERVGSRARVRRHVEPLS